MRPRLLASIAAIAGGGCWLASAFLGQDSSTAEAAPVFLAGGLLLALAAALAGYALVSTAPWWLRVVVALAVPLLAWTVWQAVVLVRGGQEVAGLSLEPVVVAVPALLLGVWGLSRRSPPSPRRGGSGGGAHRA